MQPIYLQIDNRLPLMIMPESDAHMDGHPVLTYSYAIYKDEPGDDDHHTIDTAALLAPDRKSNPNYMGVLTFEQPGRLFSYAADGPQELSGDEVQEVIEQITHYRENPALWRV